MLAGRTLNRSDSAAVHAGLSGQNGMDPAHEARRMSQRARFWRGAAVGQACTS